jgi:hypothetical protein
MLLGPGVSELLGWFIPFLINNSACLGHLERSAAESRDLVTVPRLVS